MKKKFYASLVLCSAFFSQAYTVTPDTSLLTCTYDPGSDPVPITVFWQELTRDAKELRLNELDQQDPGLKEAILAYASQPEGVDTNALQNRISATGASEGLAELIDAQDPNAPEASIDGSSTLNTQIIYTEQQAQAAINAIGSNPAQEIADNLDQSSRLSQIEHDLLLARADSFNQIQFDLRDALSDCLSELNNSKPMPTWQKIGLIILGTIITIFILRIFFNMRKPSRHAK